MTASTRGHDNHIPEPNITRFLFADTRMASVWFFLRLWLAYEWLKAAWGKWTEGGWPLQERRYLQGACRIGLCPAPTHGLLAAPRPEG